MHTSLLLVLITIIVAFCFDFLNGFHDAANSIATVVSTRVLSPRLAVVWAAAFNFIAAFIFGIAVAKTISGGLVDPAQITQYVILCALGGAIIWDILTWLWGLPTSSSHALIGGLAGAGIARAGWGVLIRQPKLHWPVIGTVPGLGEKWMATLIFIVLAPIIGLIIGLILMIAVSWIFRRSAPRTVDKLFRKLQILSAACYSLGHGGSDAQKTMGIVAGALLAAGYMSPAQFAHGWGPYKWYIILGANAAMGLGTYFGGWRIVHTMGSKITKLKPVGGFCAESAGAVTLFVLAYHGIPVSTTHTITGAIVGVGSTGRLSAVRWGVAGRIVWAWVLTIPASALVAAIAFYIVKAFVPGA
ncbi:MAG TPA: inorganic phosphate transporter [Candidatus Angelobacter sp.]|nr:inorganic phosphate transporter [Candidatus Angelobacter sp.]